MLLASSVFVIPPALAAPTTATARAAAAFSWCFSAASHRRPVPPRALFFSSAPRKNSLALSLPLPRPFLRKSHHHGHTTRPTTAALCAAAVVRRAAMAFTTRHVGAPNSLDYRVFFERDGAPVSPFHDIPLHPGNDTNVYNMVVEIPRWTNAKLEIATGESMNPIKQDVKKGKLRYVRNCFPHHGYIWNYGAFPQTWEDPASTHAETKLKGDCDPIDVLEIGEAVGRTGQIKQVKVLGIMALLDEGETDWKVFAIDIKDPLAPKLNDIEDVERHLPGLIRSTKEWFRIYKIPDGKPENQFAFSGEARNNAYAAEIIQETHESWKRLISGAVPRKTERYDLALMNVNVEGSPYKVARDEPTIFVPAEDEKPANPVDPSVDKWFFISRASSL